MKITYSDRVQILMGEQKNGLNPLLVQRPAGRNRPKSVKKGDGTQINSSQWAENDGFKVVSVKFLLYNTDMDLESRLYDIYTYTNSDMSSDMDSDSDLRLK